MRTAGKGRAVRQRGSSRKTRPLRIPTFAGTVLRHLRKQRGWDRGELASRVGMHEAEIALLETGPVFSLGDDTLRALAHLFHVDADALRESCQPSRVPVPDELISAVRRRGRSDRLPASLLAARGRLLDKKFGTGLTEEEEIELKQVDKALDEAEASIPSEQIADVRARLEHEKRMVILSEILARLRLLRLSQEREP